jgi:tRNA nucleotidyltransferase/poly(A) polymerase
MDINCTAEELAIINKVATAAEHLNVPAYLIGGFVRDKIITEIPKMQILFA